MPSYYNSDQVLSVSGYEVYFTRFSDSILNEHFKEAKAELIEILTNFQIAESEIIKGGGGKSTITQRLSGLLDTKGWKKAIIESEHQVRGEVLTSESHEIDHCRSFKSGNIGLEIEWNNKDPFYDRDLENFRKLHQIGWLSMGIIITRGGSLQKELKNVIRRFLSSLSPLDLNKLRDNNLSLSEGAQKKIKDYLLLPEQISLDKIANEIYSSKFGAATTHMDKLLLRINRGLGNPCPLILIGIGKERLQVV